jgi:hypothetical protein
VRAPRATAAFGGRRSRLERALRNVRQGRLQKTLSAATALSTVPLTFEVYLEHYKGSFGDKWEWAPIALAPAVVAAGAAGVASERAARTWLPVTAGLYGACGVIGTVLHARGVHRRPGGFREPTYNLVMGPPLLAPGSLGLVGAMGVMAALMRRER